MDSRIQSYLKYGESVWPPDTLLMECIEAGPMDQREVLRPEDINQLYDPGCFPVETGWWVMDNGAGYISVLHIMPEVTKEMFAWWFAWHPLEDNRYKIWYPPAHYWARVSEEDKEIICNPDVPLLDKIYGKVHFVSEDLAGTGEEPPYFNIHFRNPLELGFLQENVESAENVCVICAFPDMGQDVCAGGKRPSTMVHFARETDRGLEVRTRFWLGYTFSGRKPVCMIPEGSSVPEKAIYQLACHCVQEYSNLKHILPGLYEEQKNLPMV